jgi:glycerol-3-phosphate dehydrogenase (NAD(P)+)
VLASKGHEVVSWTTNEHLASVLKRTRIQPFLPNQVSQGNIHITTNLAEALSGIDMLVESVTAAGIRPVFEQVKALRVPDCPIVLTSKGIEQSSGSILPEVAVEVLGESIRDQTGALSGPGYAEEVIRGLPTSVVASAYDPKATMQICDTFTTQTFRVYPNTDITGICYGGALKNVIAIACGIADGLSLGWSARAALMTRGLHEIRKLAVANGSKAETLGGLSGMGDLCMTCSSPTSRNFRFGKLIAQGYPLKAALEEIKMVVEGIYTCVAAWELAQKLDVPMPITEAVHEIVYGGMNPYAAVEILMKRPIKEENQ